MTFKPGTDPDLAWAKVQNKLQLAQTSLPTSVQQAGVSVNKSTRNFLIIVGLVSEDGSMDGNDLRDYAQSNLEKVLSRVPGVGEVMNFGTQYSMRIWVDPERLTDYNLTFGDVTQALQNYNVEVSAGQFGGLPAVKGQRLNASIVVQNLLKTPEEFGEIPIRTNRRRLDHSDMRHRPNRTRHRILRRRCLLQRQADAPAWPSGRPRAQCLGDRQCHQEAKTGRDEPLLSARNESGLSL